MKPGVFKGLARRLGGHHFAQLSFRGILHWPILLFRSRSGVPPAGSPTPPAARPPAVRPLAGRPVVGLVEELEELVRDYEIDQLVFTPSTLSLSLEQLGRDLGVGNLRISMVPVSFAEMVAQRAADDDGPLPLIDLGEGR